MKFHAKAKDLGNSKETEGDLLAKRYRLMDGQPLPSDEFEP